MRHILAAVLVLFALPVLGSQPPAGSSAPTGNSSQFAPRGAQSPGQLQDLLNAPSLISTGLLADYAFSEGSGTVLHDYSGNGNDIAFPGSNAPTWASDGSLSWHTANATFLTVPSAVQNVQTIEIVFSNAQLQNVLSSGFNVLTGYGGAAPGLTLELANNWQGPNSGTTSEALGSKYLNYQFANTPTNQPSTSTSAVIDNDIHIATFVTNQATPSIVTVYLDGVLAQQYTTPTPLYTNAVSGGNWQIGGTTAGTNNCAYSRCGSSANFFGVRYYSTQLNAAQVSWNAKGWFSRLAARGVNTAQGSQSYSSSNLTNARIFCLGESYIWGHGLGSPTTQRFCSVAASALTTALGYTVTGTTDGEDSSNVYIMVNACQRTYFPLHSSQGLNIALLDGGDNDVYTASPTWVGLSSGNQINQAAINALITCTRTLQAMGWKVINATTSSKLSTSFGNVDSIGKDVFNPLARKYLAPISDGFLDQATDTRWGQDSAWTASGTATACAGGAVFQGDNTHLTACSNAAWGSELANIVEAMLNNGQSPQIPVSSLPYTMTGLDIGAIDRITVAGTVTMLPCGGFAPGREVMTFQVPTGVIATLTPGTEYQGGVQDQVDGSASNITLTGPVTAKFTNTFPGDAVGGCGLTRIQ